MSEIDKLYENAGIESINFAKQGAIDFTNTIEIDGKRYPDFTAEKQIELIKFFAKRELTIDSTDYGFSFSTSDGDEFAYTYITKKDFNSFENALANLANTLWQDLTEEEKQQIKEILE